MAGDISKRVEKVKDWEDFLYKYMAICINDQYDEKNNPKGYINLGTAVNYLCYDLIYPRLSSSDVWCCDSSMLQYKDGHGIPRLREILATIMTEFFEAAKPVNPNDLFCTVGVTSCLDLIGHCLADPGDVILAPSPMYGRIYTDLAQRSQVELFYIPIMTGDYPDVSETLTLEKVKKTYADAISQKLVVRGIILINPSNPLGDVYSPELLMDILLFCHEHKLHVIVDEVYALSVFPGGPEFHSIHKFPKLPDPERTHVLYGLSKDFGVAGLRIGTIHTQCKALQKCLVQLSFFHNIPFPMMDISARFLEDLEWCKKYVTTNQHRLKEKYHQCAERLKAMGLSIRDSHAGFFLWVDFRPICGSESFKQEIDFFHYLLETARVYIIPGKELLCVHPGWFRITFTGYPDDVDEGLNRLEVAVRNYKSLPS